MGDEYTLELQRTQDKARLVLVLEETQSKIFQGGGGNLEPLWPKARFGCIVPPGATRMSSGCDDDKAAQAGRPD